MSPTLAHPPVTDLLFPGRGAQQEPVLRSCEVSPAILAAMATTQPMVSAAALPFMSVQPSTRKIPAVPSSAAMVMPLVGLLVTPTSPTMREATVTKKNAKITTQTAATRRSRLSCKAAKGAGKKVRVRPISRFRYRPLSTVSRGWCAGCWSLRGLIHRPGFQGHRQLSPPRHPPFLSIHWPRFRKDSIITGRLRTSVTMPATATAPAPM